MPDLRLSTALRAAVVAGLVAAVLAVGFAFWIHHQIFTSRYHDLERQADSDRQQLIANMYGYRTLQPVTGSFAQAPTDAVFEVVDGAGKVVESSPVIGALGAVPVAPRPNRYDLTDSMFVTVRGLGPDSHCAAAPQGDCAIATRMAGRRVWVDRQVVAVRDVLLKGDPNRRTSITSGTLRSSAISRSVVPICHAVSGVNPGSLSVASWTRIAAISSSTGMSLLSDPSSSNRIPFRGGARFS